MRNLRTMTREQIEKDWLGLQKKHQMEVAERVTEYCIGHKMEEVAEWLGYSMDWLRVQLDYAGVSAALGSEKTTLTGSSNNVAKEVPRLVSEYGPDVKAEVVGQGGTDVKLTGSDAAEFEVYVDHYATQGHEPAAAIRLAKAEWAAEAAVEAGVIKESRNKQNERINKILFPDEPRQTFDIDLRTHLNRVKGAAAFLDAAKVNFLSRKSTCEMVESANDAWAEQVERVTNLHPKLLDINSLTAIDRFDIRILPFLKAELNLWPEPLHPLFSSLVSQFLEQHVDP